MVFIPSFESPLPSASKSLGFRILSDLSYTSFPQSPRSEVGGFLVPSPGS